MKKSFLLIAFTALIHFSFAQKGFHIGVDAAFNSTWILNQNNFYNLTPLDNPIVQTSEMNYKAKWGYNVGVAIGYNFKRSWGLQLEAMYNQTGQIYQDNFDGPATLIDTLSTPRIDTFFARGNNNIKVDRRVDLSYIQIPLMLKYITKGGNRAKFYLLFGPQIGIKVKNKEVMKFQDITFTPRAPYSLNEKFKVFDIGLALRVGTEVYATDNIFFDLGLSMYGGIIDLNGKVLKDLGWYSQNDVEYQRSHNFRVGITGGIHYLISKQRVIN